MVFETRQNLEMFVFESAIRNISLIELEILWKNIEDTKIAYAKGDKELICKLFVQFNSVIYAASNLPVITSLLQHLNRYLHNFRINSINNTIRCYDAILEHEQLVQCLANKDFKQSKVILQKHLELSSKTTRETIFD
ncbi:MAG: hypothetical protein ATN33_04400 [Epulopiscium sp. Nele67-Bin001]|nr:MAG: hypothetical protein ATN33_04400 [Epulopiscium sp. Nele67-Bin001]